MSHWELPRTEAMHKATRALDRYYQRVSPPFGFQGIAKSEQDLANSLSDVLAYVGDVNSRMHYDILKETVSPTLERAGLDQADVSWAARDIADAVLKKIQEG